MYDFWFFSFGCKFHTDRYFSLLLALSFSVCRFFFSQLCHLFVDSIWQSFILISVSFSFLLLFAFLVTIEGCTSKKLMIDYCRGNGARSPAWDFKALNFSFADWHESVWKVIMLFQISWWLFKYWLWHLDFVSKQQDRCSRCFNWNKKDLGRFWSQWLPRKNGWYPCAPSLFSLLVVFADMASWQPYALFREMTEDVLKECFLFEDFLPSFPPFSWLG